MIGARTRLFHAIVGLGLAGATAACSSSDTTADAPIDAGGSTDANGATDASHADGASDGAASPNDAGVDTGSPGLDSSDGDGDGDADDSDVDAWPGVPIK